jgi:hypothetical protein
MITVHCFWHGEYLSLLEKLTLKSFLANNYKVCLWRYNENLEIDCPWGVEFGDANEIIPYDEIFYYTGHGDCRQGSLGGFSDLFRYVLLFKKGGVYVDMDNTCLKYFDFSADYVFKPHLGCGTVANVLKAPKDSEFLSLCIERTKEKVTKDNNNWILPVKIFNQTIHDLQLTDFIVPSEYFGQDDPEKLKIIKRGNFIKDKSALPIYILHWCRENSYGKWSFKDAYDWNKPKPLSFYYNLLLNNGLIE